METIKRLNLLAENLASADVVLPPEDIPTLVPDSILKQWMANDKDPYFKCQAIKYPIKANGVNYQRSFFIEYISKLNKRPIPGSRDGHDMRYGVRPTTDFLLVGGKVVDSGDGTGIVHLKNYIPPQGASGPNEVFIRECKSDLVHFSIVSATRDEIIRDDQGVTVNVVGSIRAERNDAVEVDCGAMEQKTNINSPGVAGAGNLRSEDDMDKIELMKRLNALKANGEITLVEIAEAMGLKQLLATDVQLSAEKVINSLQQELKVTDPVSEIKRLRAEIDAGRKEIREATVSRVFGPEKFANGKDNDLRVFVVSQLKDETGADLEKRLNEIKKHPLALKLAAEQADHTSGANALDPSNSGQPATDKGGIRIDKV